MCRLSCNYKRVSSINVALQNCGCPKVIKSLQGLLPLNEQERGAGDGAGGAYGESCGIRNDNPGRPSWISSGRLISRKQILFLLHKLWRGREERGKDIIWPFFCLPINALSDALQLTQTSIKPQPYHQSIFARKRGAEQGGRKKRERERRRTEQGGSHGLIPSVFTHKDNLAITRSSCSLLPLCAWQWDFVSWMETVLLKAVNLQGLCSLAVTPRDGWREQRELIPKLDLPLTGYQSAHP